MKLFDSKEEGTGIDDGAPIGSTDEVGAIEKTLDTVDVNDPDAVQEVLADADINIQPDTEKCSKEEDETDTDVKKEEGKPVVTDPATADATIPVVPVDGSAGDAGTADASVTDPAATDAVAPADTEITVPSEDILEEKFDDEFEAAQEMLSDIQKLSKIACAIESRMAFDAEMLKENKLGKEHLVAAIEEFSAQANDLGLKLKFDAESISLESADGITAAFEALDGERQNVLARVKKSLANGWAMLTGILSHLDAVGKLLKSYNVEKLKSLQAELKSGARKQATSYTPVNASLNKKLAIYFAMGHEKFDVASFIAHINLAYDLIVEKKLYTDGCKTVIDELMAPAKDEKEIPVFKPAIEVLDKITLPDVRKWLNKNTKVGLINTFIGSKFAITSVFQDEKGATARTDYFSVPTNVYAGKAIPMLSASDADKILKAGIELGPKGAKLAEEGKAKYWEQIRESREKVGGFSTLFNPAKFARSNAVSTNWIGGVVDALMHLKKSHLATGSLIVALIEKMYPKV